MPTDPSVQTPEQRREMIKWDIFRVITVWLITVWLLAFCAGQLWLIWKILLVMVRLPR